MYLDSSSSSVLSSDWWSGFFLTTKTIRMGIANRKDPRASGSGKLLRQSGMFLVTDDLAITPSSSVSTMDILKKLKVPLHDIEIHKVGIGVEEAVRMLKASLSSSSALTKGLENQLKNLKK